MDKRNKEIDYTRYGAIIVAVVGFVLTYKIVATPVDVHTEVDKLKVEIAKTYATKEETKNLQRQYDNISIKIDKIYDYIITRK